VLAALGTARLHHRNFPLFLAVVLALAAAIVAVFLVTRPARGGWRHPDQGR
jgi:hypothetical protein